MRTDSYLERGGLGAFKLVKGKKGREMGSRTRRDSKLMLEEEERQLEQGEGSDKTKMLVMMTTYFAAANMFC